MIGQFRITDKRDGESFVIAESCMNKDFIGQFYIPPIYRDSCSNLTNGDTVFCVLDDQSGFGAILFKFDDKVTGNNSLKLTKNLDITGNCTADRYYGKAQMTFSLTAADCAEIVASGMSGTPPEVPIMFHDVSFDY